MYGFIVVSWFVFVVMVVVVVDVCNGWMMVQRIDIPTMSSSSSKCNNNEKEEDVIVSSFQDMIHNCPFMEPIHPTTSTSTSSSSDCCCLGGTMIPLLQNASIQLFQNNNNNNNKMVIEMKACDRNDIIFLCQQMNQLWNIPNKQTIQQVILQYYNTQPPFPGISANNNDDDDMNIDMNQYHTVLSWILTPHLMNKLKQDGFVTVSVPSIISQGVTKEALDTLSKRISHHKTTQSSRSDSVIFLSHQDAINYQLQEPYNLLMSIPSYINQYYPNSIPTHTTTTTNNNNNKKKKYEYPPLPPATYQHPLTRPKTLQAAQYQYGEYYKEHR